jgi:hypothetical protein
VAKGSHVSFEGYPRVCSGCGERALITKQSLWFESRGGVKRTWHVACRLAASR